MLTAFLQWVDTQPPYLVDASVLLLMLVALFLIAEYETPKVERLSNWLWRKFVRMIEK